MNPDPDLDAVLREQPNSPATMWGDGEPRGDSRVPGGGPHSHRASSSPSSLVQEQEQQKLELEVNMLQVEEEELELQELADPA